MADEGQLEEFPQPESVADDSLDGLGLDTLPVLDIGEWLLPTNDSDNSLWLDVAVAEDPSSSQSSAVASTDAGTKDQPKARSKVQRRQHATTVLDAVAAGPNDSGTPPKSDTDSNVATSSPSPGTKEMNVDTKQELNVPFEGYGIRRIVRRAVETPTQRHFTRRSKRGKHRGLATPVWHKKKSMKAYHEEHLRGVVVEMLSHLYKDQPNDPVGYIRRYIDQHLPGNGSSPRPDTDKEPPATKDAGSSNVTPRPPGNAGTGAARFHHLRSAPSSVLPATSFKVCHVSSLRLL